jgi:hypothetical protein
MKKQSIGRIPFELVYGMEVPVYFLLHHFTTKKEAVHARVNQLIELDEN